MPCTSSRPCVQLTNAQVGRIKSINGADFTDSLIRKDVRLGLCKIAGAAQGQGRRAPTVACWRTQP